MIFCTKVRGEGSAAGAAQSKGDILSRERISPFLCTPLRGAGNYPAALRAALFFIRFGIARQRIGIQIQGHQLAEAREDFVFELRREQHAFGIVVIADGDIFRVVPRVQELADVALRALELLAGEREAGFIQLAHELFKPFGVGLDAAAELGHRGGGGVPVAAAIAEVVRCELEIQRGDALEALVRALDREPQVVLIWAAAKETASVAVDAADVQLERLLGICRGDRVKNFAAEFALSNRIFSLHRMRSKQSVIFSHIYSISLSGS